MPTEISRTICPICHCKELQTFFTIDGRNLLICSNCRHVFFKNIPSIVQLKDYYKNDYSIVHRQIEFQSGNEEYYKSHFQELVRYCGCDSDISILDYGCSCPIFLNVAKELGAAVMGCDYDAETIAYGKQLGISIITPEDLSQIHQKFDVIRFSHVLEHLVDPLEVMCFVRSLLKPSGIVYITQPCIPLFQLKEFPSTLTDVVYPSHLHFFNPLSVVELSKSADFSVFRLFTHQNESSLFTKYRKYVDYAKSVSALRELSNCGDNYFGVLNNYPHFMGEIILAVLKASPSP